MLTKGVIGNRAADKELKMTNVEKAFAELNAAQDAASIVFRNLTIARNALKRSKSKKNMEAFIAAEHEADAALAITDAAHEALDAAYEADAAIEAATSLAADVAASPEFAF